MARQSVYIFSLLLAALLGALVWLGVRMAREEERFVRAEYEELVRSRLHAVSAAVLQFKEGYAERLQQLLRTMPRERAGMRAFLLRAPLVEQVFILDTRGQPAWPHAHAGDLSESETQFLQRTTPIWEGGRLLDPAAPERGGSGGKVFSKVAAAPAAPYLWHPYYWSDGLHVLFSVREEGGTVGFELNSARFFADLIDFLASQPLESRAGEAVLLKDAQGRVFFQSRGGWNEKTPTLLVESLPEPFGAWKLVAVSEVGLRVGRSALYNMLSATFLIALVVLLLGMYYVRAQRREMREAAQRVDFVNQVSHELKTPLTNIRMYAELLAAQVSEEDEKARRHVEVIVAESQRLSRLIGNVLTFGGKERGKLRFSPRRANLREALLETIDHFRPALADKGIHIECDAQEYGEVFADRDIFQQIVSNLLSNVEKYAAAGRYLGVSLRAEGDETLVVVRDRGPGIPPQERARIFEPFYRISNKLTDGVAGAGIGLTIVRDLARLHGGGVRIIESDMGAAFEVRLASPRTLPGESSI